MSGKASGGPIFVTTPVYEADIGPHVFPVRKYRDVRESLAARDDLAPGHFVAPDAGDRAWIRRLHSDAYLEDFFACRPTPAVRQSELPISPEIVTWFETAVYGTVTATRLARARGAAYHVGGGFHHAFADHAEGFCYLNDVAVAARLAVDDGATVSVVDLDVHQGNGTARIFQGEPAVFTFSMHQENNYPIKETGDLDIGLRDGIADEEYLTFLEQGLAESVLARKPDLVYYVAGADPYREDQLGGLALTMQGLRARDRAVFEVCRTVGADVVVALAGGYAMDVRDTGRIHVQTAEELLRLWPAGETTP
jgi:acetoin utilization deacetylase AcuC-like enzyme